MPTNITPYNLEVDLRQELLDLFTGDEFVSKWQPYILRQSILDDKLNKTKCTCYNQQTNEGMSDCPYCLGSGYIWREVLIPGYRWNPRAISLSAQNSYKSYGGRVGRLDDTDYLLVTPYQIRVSTGDNIYQPAADENGGIIFPVLKAEEFYISGTMEAVFDQGKKDFTIIGLKAV